MFILQQASKTQATEDYLFDQSVEAQEALKTIMDCIFKVVPTATALINYNIPAFSLIEGGKRDKQIMVAAYKNHIGFYPPPFVIEHFSKELEAYKFAKGSIQFPLNEPMPEALVLSMIEYALEKMKT